MLAATAPFLSKRNMSGISSPISILISKSRLILSLVPIFSQSNFMPSPARSTAVQGMQPGLTAPMSISMMTVQTQATNSPSQKMGRIS